MAYILMFFAGIAVAKLFQAVRRRRNENRQAKCKRLEEEVRGKSRFGNNGYKSWQDEVKTDRRKPELITVEGR